MTPKKFVALNFNLDIEKAEFDADSNAHNKLMRF
jgi:hypothetical protein